MIKISIHIYVLSNKQRPRVLPRNYKKKGKINLFEV